MIKQVVKSKAILNNNTLAIVLALRHPKTPPFSKLVALAVLVYMFMPIDIIPDVIPVLGWIDDLGIAYYLINWAGNFIPEPVMRECRAEAVVRAKQIKRGLWMLFIVFVIVSIAMIFLLWNLLEWFFGLF